MEHQDKSQETLIKPEIGLSVLINEKEYTISEHNGDQWVLYRERIDGSAETKTLTAQEVEDYLN
ncbi:MAG: hypothetical protein GXO90_08820 [FCB group bacterium]|nr:hypothetical protein [FCB group bacterium]